MVCATAKIALPSLRLPIRRENRRPRRQMLRGRELSHVDTDLGDHDFSDSLADPGDRAQQLDLFSERVELTLHLPVEPLDRRGELVDVTEMQRQHQRVMIIEAALQSEAQLADLGTHPGQGHLSHRLDVTITSDQRIDHPPRGLAITSDTTESSLIPAVSNTF
jgi:hypothetical protein